MFKDRDQFNLFIKEMDNTFAEQVLRETVADVCIHGGNNLRNLLDSYSVFLKSGDFNMNMRDFEGKLAEFLVPSFASNASIYESSRIAQLDEKAMEAVDGFNVLSHIRENLGQDQIFNAIQDGIKQAHSWIN